MKAKIKQVAAINDLSGFGRASLACIIPILSTMGIQVCPIPTTILSTHTGGFDGYSFFDLTDELPAFTAHWKKLGLTFDCLYSGYLGSPRQAELIEKMFDDFSREDTMIVVDPVMGDNGHLYSSVSEEMIPSMRRLLKKADIIVPNFTEAAYLLNREMKPDITTEELKEWLRSLSDLGPETVLITSAPDIEQPDRLSVVAYERNADAYWKVTTRKLADYYPGTGDIFASVMIGYLLQGESLPATMDFTAQFIAQCIQTTAGYDYDRNYGVLLEKELPLLRMTPKIHGFTKL